MKGHIRQRSPGRWAIVIELRDPATGKRRRKWHKFAGTKRKAQDECARLISELNGGLYIEPAKITVGQFRPLVGAHQAAARRSAPDQIAADADFRSVRQRSVQRPQESQGRTCPQHGALLARNSEANT